MAADRQQYTMFSFQSQDPKANQPLNSEQQDMDSETVQNQTIFMKWNTKPNPNYKLQYYNYFSDFAGSDFQLKTYNKFTNNHKPLLQYYMRFSQALFPEQIENNKQSHYNSFLSDPFETEIITKPYTGRYSLQPDFHFFRRN